MWLGLSHVKLGAVVWIYFLPYRLGGTEGWGAEKRVNVVQR